MTTHANNICMKNLNGGFFASAALNIAMSDGQVIGDTNNMAV